MLVICHPNTKRYQVIAPCLGGCGGCGPSPQGSTNESGQERVCPGGQQLAPADIGKLLRAGVPVLKLPAPSAAVYLASDPSAALRPRSAQRRRAPPRSAHPKQVFQILHGEAGASL